VALERRRPVREAFPAPEEYLPGSLFQPFATTAPGYSFPVDVSETDNDYLVRASLPGFRPEDIQVDVRGNTLTILARRTHAEERRGEDWLLRERQVGAFFRAIELPGSVDADRARGTMTSGS
jgi:HSP20 family protein